MKRICGFIMVLIMLLTGPASAIAKVSRNEAKLLCLNIGKADCMLLLYGNTNWLIDTGYEVTYNALKTALDEYQIDHLDGVFLTHCHEDHDGGLMPLAQSNIPVNAWSNKKRDVGILYDPWGRQVVCADNGLME